MFSIRFLGRSISRGERRFHDRATEDVGVYGIPLAETRSGNVVHAGSIAWISVKVDCVEKGIDIIVDVAVYRIPKSRGVIRRSASHPGFDQLAVSIVARLVAVSFGISASVSEGSPKQNSASKIRPCQERFHAGVAGCPPR